MSFTDAACFIFSHNYFQEGMVIAVVASSDQQLEYGNELKMVKLQRSRLRLLVGRRNNGVLNRLNTNNGKKGYYIFNKLLENNTVVL